MLGRRLTVLLLASTLTTGGGTHSAIDDQAQAASPPGAVQDAARLGDRILDPSARGVVTFENTANVASYQQDGLLTYRGFQYTAWYRNNLRVVVARRALPDGRWQSTELDYELYRDDSHNTVALGITPSDGRIHLMFPTHAYAVRYTRSVPGVADNPRRVTWSSRLFERTRDSLPGAPEAPATFTYPQFEMVQGRMLLTWRDGSSINGRQVLLRYDDNAEGTWSHLGAFTSGSGSYTSEYGTSTSRYGYLHGFTANPVNGNLEITFTWRERGPYRCPSGTGDFVSNHDTGYAYSTDAGKTWRNNDGQVIGVLGTDDLVSIDDEHVVEEIPLGRGLMNAEAQAFDSRGRLHVMTSRIPERDLDEVGGCVSDFYRDRARYARPYHTWRADDGTWHTMELPVRQNSSGRTKLVFDRHDTAYVVLPDARIIAATAASRWTDWRVVWDAPDVRAVSELVVDRTRIRHDGVLSVSYQEPSGGCLPSAYRVADFRLSTLEPDRPKAEEPEAEPKPYEGGTDGGDDSGDDNLAVNRSGRGHPAAFADSHQRCFPAFGVNDGGTRTFWVASGYQTGDGPSADDPAYVGVDFGEQVRFNEVTMVPRRYYGPTSYTIEVSADGESWTTVAEESAVPDASTTSRLSTLTARYVRLRITGARDRVYPARNVQVVELEVRSR